MSAEKTGKNGPSLPVPPEEEEEAAAPARARRPRRAALWRRGSRRPPAGQAPQRTPLPRKRRQPRRPSEFSDAVAIQIPSQVPTGARKPYFIFGDAPELGGSLVLRSGPPRSASVHRQGKRGHRSQRHGRCSPASRATTRENGRSSSSGPFAPASGAAFTPGEFMPIAFSVWDGFSRERGNRRGLTVWYSALRRAGSRPIGRRPDGEDGAAHSRHRAGRDRLGAVGATALAPAGSSAVSQTQPAATTSVSCRRLSGGSDVQEHLRSRR